MRRKLLEDLAWQGDRDQGPAESTKDRRRPSAPQPAHTLRRTRDGRPRAPGLAWHDVLVRITLLVMTVPFRWLLLPCLLHLSAANLHAQAPRGSASLGAEVRSGLVSVNWKDADLGDALRLIADVGGINLVLDPSVKGRSLTLALKDVPWEQAFSLACSTGGFGVVMEGNVARVAPMNLLIQENQQRAQLAEARRASAPLSTIAFPLSWANATAAEAIVRKSLSPRGSIQVDRRTNMLIITDAFEEGSLSSIREAFQPGMTPARWSGATGQLHEIHVSVSGLGASPVVGMRPVDSPGGSFADSGRGLRVDLAVGERAELPGHGGLTVGLERDGSRLVLVARSGRVGAQVPAEGLQALQLFLASGEEALLVAEFPSP